MAARAGSCYEPQLTMVHVLAGCVLERLPGPRALGRLRFFEYAPRPPLPAYATLARLRKQLGTTWPEIALVAPKSTWSTARGPLRPGPELDAGVAWITRAADILECFAIVLATGAELSTGERDRGLLANVVERLRGTGRTVVIAPRGLWEPEHAEPFAAQIGAVYGFDPLEHDAPRGEFVYARVRPMGARPRLTEGHLAQIAERVASAACERGYVSIESEQCVRDAARLTRQLVAHEGEAELADVDDEPDVDEPDVDDDESELDAAEAELDAGEIERDSED